MTPNSTGETWLAILFQRVGVSERLAIPQPGLTQSVLPDQYNWLWSFHEERQRSQRQLRTKVSVGTGFCNC